MPTTTHKSKTPEFYRVKNLYDSSYDASKYRIQVNTQSGFDGTSLWDSGSAGTPIGGGIENERTYDIAYRGDPLTFATTTYFWRTKFWDSNGNEGGWSATSTLQTANKTVFQDLHYTYDSVGNIMISPSYIM